MSNEDRVFILCLGNRLRIRLTICGILPKMLFETTHVYTVSFCEAKSVNSFF